MYLKSGLLSSLNQLPEVDNHTGLTPKQKGCVLASCLQGMTVRSAECEQVANHPGLSAERTGSGMKAELGCLTTVSTGYDKADFPPQLTCEMRVRVNVSGKTTARDEVSSLVLPRKRKMAVR